MAETTRELELPLVQPAQAQKHVTVNEALLRLDALAQLRLVSLDLRAPPQGAAPGSAYGVPGGGEGAWAGQAGRIAIAGNGGWIFATPRQGWRAFVIDRGVSVTHDGADWTPESEASGPGGAAMRFEVIGFDHDIVRGRAQLTDGVIPSHAMVFGVTARVIEEITGSLSTWRLGVSGSDNRFGQGLGRSAGSYSRGVLSVPITDYSDTRLLLSPDSGSFSGGKVRLAVHCLRLGLPAWPL